MCNELSLVNTLAEFEINSDDISMNPMERKLALMEIFLMNKEENNPTLAVHSRLENLGVSGFEEPDRPDGMESKLKAINDISKTSYLISLLLFAAWAKRPTNCWQNW